MFINLSSWLQAVSSPSRSVLLTSSTSQKYERLPEAVKDDVLGATKGGVSGHQLASCIQIRNVLESEYDVFVDE